MAEADAEDDFLELTDEVEEEDVLTLDEEVEEE